MAVFDFDKAARGFRLRTVHPPYSTADIRPKTGFGYEEPENVPVTTPPDAATLSLIRGHILYELAETYPAFTKLMVEVA